MKNQILKELTIRRQEWVKSTRDNRFENGISNLLTELYPDNAHFIYELLQNAEDAGASKIEFFLDENQLKLVHNGTRLFNNDDIDGITSIGQGTKANDLNKIGKFGVGFKAVFSYTSTPIIHSGNFHFKIQDLVVPIEIEKIETELNTIMIFPFNGNKDKMICFKEISNWFNTISETVLLFLTNINEINIQFKNKNKLIKRVEKGNEVELYNNNIKSEWLRFSKNINGYKNLFVSIAYNVTKDEKTGEKKVTPINNSNVFIYLPAEKEISNLKFHIHAPFLCTVARDSIKTIQENNEFILQISDLICDSFSYIKENNFLKIDFFEIMPIQEDNLAPFYIPIQENINEYLYHNDFIPSDDKNFYPAFQCHRTTNKIKNIFSLEIINLLFDLQTDIEFKWCVNYSNKPRLNKFLNQLNILDINESKIYERFNYLYWIIHRDKDLSNYELNEIKNKLNLLGNSELKSFYSFLYEYFNSNSGNYRDNEFYFTYLIRFKDGQMNFNNEPCYFESEFDAISNDVKLVNPDVYEADLINNKEHPSKKFLKELNVRSFEKSEEVKVILEKYYKGTYQGTLPLKRHVKHWKLFIQYYNENQEKIKELNDYYILLDGNNTLNKPENILLIGGPFKPTVNNLFGYSNYSRLNIDLYSLSNFNEISFQKFHLIVTSLKTANEIKIIKTTISQHNTSYRKLKSFYQSNSTYRIDVDYYIDDFNFFISKPDINKSLIVWNSIKNISNKFFNAEYSARKDDEVQSIESRLIHQLKTHKWIPDKIGDFYFPSDINQEMLRDEFIYNNKNGIFDALNFGINLKKVEITKEEEEKLNQHLNDEYGIGLNNLKDKKFQEFLLLPENVQEELLAQTKKKPNLNENLVKHNKTILPKEEGLNLTVIEDPDKYAEQINENSKNKPTNIASQKNYTVTQKSDDKEVKNFLKNQYKGICQICEFKFQQKNGGNYFEVFNWIKKDDKYTNGGSMCLCARCHSIVKNGDFEALFYNDVKKIKNLSAITFDEFTTYFNYPIRWEKKEKTFKNFDAFVSDMYRLKIRILNKEKYIYYTEDHFIHFFNSLKG